LIRIHIHNHIDIDIGIDIDIDIDSNIGLCCDRLVLKMNLFDGVLQACCRRVAGVLHFCWSALQ